MTVTDTVKALEVSEGQNLKKYLHIKVGKKEKEKTGAEKEENIEMLRHQYQGGADE